MEMSTLFFRIIEAGSFKGKSAVDFARICKELAINRRCIVIAVDTWTGSSEHFEFSLDDRSLRDSQGSLEYILE
jgi:hypothetical protein